MSRPEKICPPVLPSFSLDGLLLLVFEGAVPDPESALPDWLPALHGSHSLKL